MTTRTLKIGVITLFYRKYKTAREFLTETVGFAFIGKTCALTLCVYNCVSVGFMLHLSFARGGGGYSTKFYTGRLRPEVQPLTLLYTIFDRRGTPFVYLPLNNSTPFTYLLLSRRDAEHCVPFLNLWNAVYERH